MVEQPLLARLVSCCPEMIIPEGALFVTSSISIFSSAIQILIVKGSAQYYNVYFVDEIHP